MSILSNRSLLHPTDIIISETRQLCKWICGRRKSEREPPRRQAKRKTQIRIWGFESMVSASADPKERTKGELTGLCELQGLLVDAAETALRDSERRIE